MSRISVPSTEQVRSLPSSISRVVPQEYIDENGHMNITHFFGLGSLGPWTYLTGFGLGQPYIENRALSFFTVEHHIRYLGELRLGEQLAVHVGLAGRTAKALHAVSYVLDETHDRVACVMELMYVHVSMESRRATDIPEDVATTLDAEIAAHSWIPQFVGGLTLR